MGRRRITLVAGEPVAGIFQLESSHQPIPGHLGEDRGRPDGRNEAVSTDDGAGRTAEIRGPVAVHQHLQGPGIQRRDGSAHGEQAGLKDIDAVDLAGARVCHRPSQRSALDLGLQDRAPGGRQTLGVVQPGDGARGVEDHGRGGDRPGQGPAAGLVDTGDQ